MTPTQRLQQIADLLRDAGHPDITSVTVLDTPTVRADQADGSANYFKVAHHGRVSDPTPAKPSWPGHARTETKGGGK